MAVAQAIDAIRALSGCSDFGGAIDTAESLRLASAGRRLVYLCPMQQAGMAFLVDGENGELEVTAIPLLAFDATSVQDAADRLIAAAEQRGSGKPDNWQAWREALGGVIAWQRQSLAPLLQALRTGEAKAREIALIPIGAAALLPPLCALEPEADELFAEATVAPSARLLARRRQAGPPADMAAANQLFIADHDIFYAEPAGRMLAKTLGGGDVLLGKSVDKTALLEMLDARRQALIFAHGRPDLSDPKRSALLLDGTNEAHRFSVWDILSTRLHSEADLIILACCSLALPGQRAPIEMVSLPAALLHAGAGKVVAALWDVDIHATILLMERFHEALARGLSAPKALATAQAWMRSVPAEEKRAHFETLMGPAQADSSSIRSLSRVLSLGRRRENPTKLDGFDDFHHPSHWAGFVVFG